MKSLLNALQEGRLVELPDTNKEKSLEYLAHIIEAIPDLSTPPELAEAMIARERQQNTGLGLGVACPHVRAAGAGDLLCAVGWSPAGIDYGAPDSKKVHLVVMYYIPDAQKNTYLKEISSLAGAIRKEEEGIQSIARAEDIAGVREQLLDWVSAAIDANIPETKARMIRLEARQAAIEAIPLAQAQALLQIEPVTILSMPVKQFVLCHNPELASTMEKDANLATLLKQRAQFDLAGYRLVFRSVQSYDPDKNLYEYLAIKLNSSQPSA